jgi:CubicO group peptidase (beta-lactamase class C family)
MEFRRMLFRSIEADPDSAVGYVVIQGKPVRKPFPYGITSDGGLFSNTLDLAKYLRMFLNRGDGIVSKESIEAMEKPYIGVPWQLFGGESYGYGLIIYPNFLGRRLIGHSGSVLNYTGFIGYIPSEDIGIAVLENSPNYPPS